MRTRIIELDRFSAFLDFIGSLIRRENQTGSCAPDCAQRRLVSARYFRRAHAVFSDVGNAVLPIVGARRRHRDCTSESESTGRNEKQHTRHRRARGESYVERVEAEESEERVQVFDLVLEQTRRQSQT